MEPRLFKDQVIRVEGHKVKAVDATGAGDAFWGGFMSSLRIQGVSRAEDLTAISFRKPWYTDTYPAVSAYRKGSHCFHSTRAQIEEYMKTM